LSIRANSSIIEIGYEKSGPSDINQNKLFAWTGRR
jgi:hypothetical protein